MNGVEVWSQINATIDVITWPALIAAALIGFRKPVSDRIRHIRKATTPVGNVDFDPAAEAIEMTEGIAAARSLFADPTPASQTQGAEPEAEQDTGNGSNLGRVPGYDKTHSETKANLLERRRNIEEIIRASWTSGYEAGESGMYSAPPTPIIEWTGTVPRVTGWTADLKIIKDTARQAFGFPPRPTGQGTHTVMELDREEARLRSWDHRLEEILARIEGLPPTAAARALQRIYAAGLEGHPELKRLGDIAYLEDEIRRLDGELKDRPARTSEDLADRNILEELRYRLRLLDPTSPYAQ